MKIKQTIFIDYGHRLLDSEHLITKKCLHSHGHTAKITIEAEQDNIRAGMIIDFSAIKEIVNRFDHRMILNFKDPLYQFLLLEKPEQVVGMDSNPTIENLAKEIANLISFKYPDLKNLKVSAIEGYKGEEHSPIITYES